LSNSYSCHKEAFCVNTKGSYGCSCNPGLTGDGKRKCDGKSYGFIRILNKNHLVQLAYNCALAILPRYRSIEN